MRVNERGTNSSGKNKNKITMTGKVNRMIQSQRLNCFSILFVSFNAHIIIYYYLAVSGTDKDLRKLSMKEMARILLEEYAVQPKHIATLGRWDRVHMIRELSTKAASDNTGDGMERYARGEKIKLRDKIDSYKKRIQEIWERQLTFLGEIEEEISSDKPEPLLKENTNLSNIDNDDDDDYEEEEDDEEDDYV